MWEKLKIVYRGDLYVQKEKVDNFKGKFDEMKMMENKNIEKCNQMIKYVVSSIRGYG